MCSGLPQMFPTFTFWRNRDAVFVSFFRHVGEALKIYMHYYYLTHNLYIVFRNNAHHGRYG